LLFIKIHNFSDGIHELEFNESVKKLNLDEPFENNVLCKIRMDKSSGQIVIDGEIECEANLTCDRCGEVFHKDLKNEFKNVYIFSNEPQVSEEENVYYLNREADKIDLTDDIKDYARLSIPMKVLCNDECKGLCVQCGTNLNYSDCNCKKEIDSGSVWSALNKLKNLDN